MAARASLLADSDQAVHRTRHRAAHEQEIALGIHFDDAQAELGEVAGAHMPGHPLSFNNPRRVGPRRDRSRLAVARVAVRLGTAAEVMTVHDALEAAPLRDAAHLHAIALGVRLAFFAPKPSSAVPSATEMTGHGPASITVTGTCAPSALNTRVIPSLRPISPFMSLLDFDFDVHARRQVQLRECIHRLRPRIEDVDQPFMRLELELLPALLVDVRAAEHRPQLPLCRQRNRTRDLRAGFLSGTDNVRRGLINQRVIEGFEPDANLAGHYGSYLRILVTTPAPTVRPPSRIANRSCSSIAIGVISSIIIFVLSPGITISTPAGNSTLPVTSVVRK